MDRGTQWHTAWRTVGCLAVFVGAQAASWTVVAQSPAHEASFDLEWARGDGAASCPNRAALAADVARRLGYDPFRASASQSLEVFISRAEAGWAVQIQARDEAGASAGRRELESSAPDCQGVFDATSLALALAIDPEAVDRNRRNLGAGDPPPALPPRPEHAVAAPPRAEAAACLDRPEYVREACPGPTSTPADPREPRNGHRVPLALSASARGVGGTGLLPRPSLGAMLGAGGWITGTLGWGVDMTLFPSIRRAAGDASLGFGLTAAGANGRVALWSSDDGLLELDLGAMAGVMHVVVYDPIPTEPGDYPWFAVRAGATGMLRVHGPLWLDASLAAVARLGRRDYFVEGETGTVFQDPRVSAIASIGVTLGFS